MRQMSFFHTQRQLADGTKDVTRRLGWANLKPGERFRAVVKSRGLKRGEKVQKLGVYECVSNRRERLDAITAADVAREGFPGVMRRQFVEFFCRNMKCRPSTRVQRIEFRPVLPTLMIVRRALRRNRRIVVAGVQVMHDQQGDRLTVRGKLVSCATVGGRAIDVERELTSRERRGFVSVAIDDYVAELPAVSGSEGA